MCLFYCAVYRNHKLMKNAIIYNFFMNKKIKRYWKIISGGSLLTLSLIATSQATCVSYKENKKSVSSLNDNDVQTASAYLFFEGKKASNLSGTISYTLSSTYLDIVSASPDDTSTYPWQNLILKSTVDISSNVYTVRAILPSAFQSLTALEQTFTITKGIESIGSYAFESCTNLTAVIMNDGIKSIGAYTFHSCSNLQEVRFGSGLYTISNDAFDNCTSLTSLNLPTGLQGISPRAFMSCSNLTSVELPDGLTSLGYDVFAYCPNLTRLSFDPQLSVTGSLIVMLQTPLTQAYPLTVEFRKGFDYHVLIDRNLFPDYVFSNNSYASRDSNRPITFKVPESEETEFSNAITNSVWFNASIGDNIVPLKDPTGELDANKVFSGDPTGKVCYKIAGADEIALLPEISDGDSNATTIVTGTNLTLNSTVKINDILYTIQRIDANTFDASNGNNLSGSLSFKNCDYLTTIGDNAFAGEDITSLDFTQCIHLSSIGVDAFSYTSCVGMVDFTECTELTTIGASAFQYSKLTSMILPSSMTTVGENVLDHCANLKAISLAWTDLTWLALGTWDNKWLGNNNANTVNSIVPYGLKTEYQDNAANLGIELTNITDTYNNYATPSTFFENATSENSSGYVCYEIVDDSAKDKIHIVSHDTMYSHFTSSVSGHNLKLKSSVQIGTETYTITGIDQDTFTNDHNLTGILDLSINNRIESIGDNAFAGCTNLQSVNLSGCTSLTSIGNNAFGLCELTMITPPNSWKNQTNSYFVAHEYTDKAGHTIGMMVSEINSNIPVGNLAYGYIQLDMGTSTSIPNNAFINCAGITSIDLSLCSALTTIGTSSFSNCTNLSAINMSSCNALTTIDDSSFASCYNLADIEFPSNLKSINDNAFSDCYDLISIDLPTSITKVGANAFVMHEMYRSRLNSLTLNWTDPEQVKVLNDNFLGDKNEYPTNVQAVYVPSEAYNAYDGYIQNAGWWITNQMTLTNIPSPTPTPGKDNTLFAVSLGLGIGLGVPLLICVVGLIVQSQLIKKLFKSKKYIQSRKKIV